MNNHAVLVVGQGNTGKSTSLRNLRDRAGYAYFNTDQKPLAIRGAKTFLVNQFINDPLPILDFYRQLEEHPKCNGIILDTLSFLMEQYERKIVQTSTNTMTAWGDYGAFYGDLTDLIKASKKPQVVMAHTDTQLNEQSGNLESKILVKGAVGKRGPECDYSIVVTTKQMPILKLREFESPLLKFTEEEEATGMKYVFNTRITKATVGDRTRAPMGMWDLKETYIDNDIQIVLDRITEYYSGEY